MKTNQSQSDQLVVIVTCAGKFWSISLSDKAYVDNLRAQWKGLPSDRRMEVTAIPLATVLAAPKLLAVCRDVLTSHEHELTGGGQVYTDVVALRAAISEAYGGGSTPVTASPQQNSPAESAPETSPFTVCAYKPERERFPVIALRTKNGNYISTVIRRTDESYQSVRESAGGDQNIKWLYNQAPQPLD